jgi:phosphinothricin acetyltransferase
MLPIVRNRLSAVIHAEVRVRPAIEADLETINTIYNHYVVETHVTFDDEPVTMEARLELFSHYADTGRLTSVETSIYLSPDVTGKGVGSQLYSRLFKELEGEDLHRAFAGIALPNPASIGLHEKFGFKRVALFTEQGRKFGRYWDVAWYEKPLGGGT